MKLWIAAGCLAPVPLSFSSLDKLKKLLPAVMEGLASER
tara:strand:+ start:368 stop:484 length:117 start_codon:yes stop_codon:yes gene_type:complete